ncbi:MAG: PepSY domain-containing protein [Nanoarchaeota archaeon]|nr:PepSY domain-containing protein [Nanoarchaeota archaeon]
MKKIFGFLGILIILFGFVLAENNTIGNSSENPNNSLKCKSLYYFDNENKNCDLKKFCGMYMYHGLQVFGSKSQCEHSLNNSKPECYADENCPELCPSCLNKNNCTNCLSQKCINGKCNIQKINEIKNETIRKKICPTNTTEENRGCMKLLSNGRKAEIKIMPETASAKAIEKLGELGFNITLKETGEGNSTKAVYELSSEKQGKFLGLFKTKGKVKVYVDTETGEIIKVRKPWWAFLATRI